ncbi:MAG: FAD-dependent oxidoreductase [Acidimicrobiia bacterium]|nr:MAG: FAD-dependent oxidoreductase [Acidimicrobiia bacterium]
MSSAIVLGGGIVGTAAAWDMARRGHQVTVADQDLTAASAAAEVAGATPAELDARDGDAVRRMLDPHDIVVSALPYSFGMAIASAAVDTRTHYLDFGGNPSIVAAQRSLDAAAREAGIAVIPDCGLAPGMANVLATGAVEAIGEGPIDEVRLRVGALPAHPRGALGYQLAFNPAGLINEYAEPCEVLHGGVREEVEPLTEIEEIAWEGWGPLEAFHTAGGSSSLPDRWEGRVASLDYKTLRFPGHAAIMRAMLEVGLFDEDPQPGTGVAPRSVLLEALAQHLPRGAEDVVLVRVWAVADRGGRRRVVGHQVEDRHDGTFSALARTTAFPTTALAHLLATGSVSVRGVATMEESFQAEEMMGALAEVGVRATPIPD